MNRNHYNSLSKPHLSMESEVYYAFTTLSGEHNHSKQDNSQESNKPHFLTQTSKIVMHQVSAPVLQVSVHKSKCVIKMYCLCLSNQYATIF